jgi:glycosyltransferase involved in cell wall biosynthesis
MMRALIVVPAHNEELVIERNVRALHDFCSKNLSIHDWNVLIASNGSTDATAAIGARLSQELPRVAIVDFPEGGRGRTLRRVWGESDADVLVYMDADLSTDLEALPKLLAALAGGMGDIAIGSRFAKGAKVDRSLTREITSRGYRALVRLLLGLRASDAQCGFKGVRREAFAQLAPKLLDNNWFFDTELLLHAERNGMRVVEVPVSWVEDRVKGRKSTVRLMRTILDNIKTVIAFGFREGWR